MKNHILLFTIFSVVMTACQDAKQSTTDDAVSLESIDKEVIKEEVAAIVHQFHKAINQKDAVTMDSLLTDDGLYCGNDPGELMDKATMVNYIKQGAEMEELQPNYSIDTQKIKVGKDGKSAIVVEHMVMHFISPIPIRQVTYLIKSENQWLIDFASMAFTPPNQDLPVFNKVSPVYKARVTEELW